MDPVGLLRLLLDADRLAVVGAVARAPGDATALAEHVGQSEQDVVRTLAPLVQAGLVSRDGQRRYALVADGWRAVVRELPQFLRSPRFAQAPPPSRRVAFGLTDDEARVIAPYFRGDRLVELPAARGRRLVVLERLALEFEPGVRYAEAEVNELLRRFNDDYATLRRLLVDEGFLDRAKGEYWRSGGRVPDVGSNR